MHRHFALRRVTPVASIFPIETVARLIGEDVLGPASLIWPNRPAGVRNGEPPRTAVKRGGEQRVRSASRKA